MVLITESRAVVACCTDIEIRLLILLVLYKFDQGLRELLPYYVVPLANQVVYQQSVSSARQMPRLLLYSQTWARSSEPSRSGWRPRRRRPLPSPDSSSPPRPRTSPSTAAEGRWTRRRSSSAWWRSSGSSARAWPSTRSTTATGRPRKSPPARATTAWG